MTRQCGDDKALGAGNRHGTECRSMCRLRANFVEQR